jgi:acetyl-CoA C-acetyltransferase
MRMATWLLPGPRTPFVRSEGVLARYDALALARCVVEPMLAQLDAGVPDMAVWGTVVPNLGWSNIAREVLLDLGATSVPAFSTIMACATSMIGVCEAAGMLNDANRSLALVGGSESLSGIAFSVTSRTTGKSMGEHMEMIVSDLRGPSREEQDEYAMRSHAKAVAGWDGGFYDDLVIALPEAARDTVPRRDSTLEKLAKLTPVFDKSGNGSVTAGNASPLTDGAAGVWVASDRGHQRLPASLPRVQLVDWEIAAVDPVRDGLLNAPAYAIPPLLARHGLRYDDIALWEIHEAFAAQVLAHIVLLEREHTLGAFPRDRVNPNGGSLSLGHPFGATGARILSQAVKELAAMRSGSYAIVSVCADGGEGCVALLQTP